MIKTRRQAIAAICWSPLLLHGQEKPAADPWTKSQLLEPADLAAEIKTGRHAPIIFVGFPVLYRNKHIAGAVLAGPGGKPEGLTLLKAAVQNLSKDTPLVIYCGCCPFQNCPNIRPAFKTLTNLGFTRFRVLDIPVNLHNDWVAKGYPVEPA